ncbi:MAG: right-handed parallel beta-helix repeat-containing protein, partial [Acidobacteria bacterium]|nr:right-handed parallel beta-helix repeat-containing protein [Acidobacteriota bacterium]
MLEMFTKLKTSFLTPFLNGSTVFPKLQTRLFDVLCLLFFTAFWSVNVPAQAYSENIFDLLGSKFLPVAKVSDSSNSLVNNHLTAKPTGLLATLIVDDDLACPGATFSTISAAVAAAIAGDTIQVCAGTYNEFVTVDKTLTILGAQNGVDARTRTDAIGTESVVNSTGSPGFDVGFYVRANGVVINGFIVQDGTTGIFTEDTFSGYQILNNIIQNNTIGLYLNNNGAQQTIVRNNAFKTNNLPGSASGDGIYSDQGARVLIDANSFTGHTADSMIFTGTQSNITVLGNQFTSNNKSMVFLGVNRAVVMGNTVTTPLEKAIELDGGNNNVLITCNTIVNSPVYGISVINPHEAGPNTDVRINNNNIQGNLAAGLEVSVIGYTGTINAENNYWGSPTGPTIASNPGGTGDKIIDPNNMVDYMPFLTALSTCAPTPIPRRKFDFDGDGRADLSVFRPSDSVWYLLNSQTGYTNSQFGISTDKLAPADYDGDGKTDIAVYRPAEGVWYLLRSS